MKKPIRLILILILILGSIGCSKVDFDGEVVSNENEFAMEYSLLNVSKSHSFELVEGNKISVQIEKESGKLNVSIKDDNGNEVYKGNDVSSGRYEISVKENGTYTIEVTGDNSSGSVSFRKK